MQFSTVSAFLATLLMATSVAAEPCTPGTFACDNFAPAVVACDSAGGWVISANCGSAGCEYINGEPFCA